MDTSLVAPAETMGLHVWYPGGPRVNGLFSGCDLKPLPLPVPGRLSEVGRPTGCPCEGFGAFLTLFRQIKFTAATSVPEPSPGVISEHLESGMRKQNSELINSKVPNRTFNSLLN